MNEKIDFFPDKDVTWGEEGTKKDFKKKNKNDNAALQYLGKNHAPSYEKFKTPEFIDLKGREYRRASSEFIQRFVEEGTASERLPEDLPLFKNGSWGTQILWVRIPIRLRGTASIPAPESEDIELMELKTQIKASGITIGSFFDGKKKTGFILLSSFKTHGQIKDPSIFLEQQKIKHKKQFF